MYLFAGDPLETPQGPNFENNRATVSSSHHYLHFVYKLFISVMMYVGHKDIM